LRERETLLGNHVRDEGVKGTGSVTIIKYVTIIKPAGGDMLLWLFLGPQES